jgi:flavin reductase (DIM6/NTAB) family NADH-FMN oxidoreductase RutF
LRLATPSTAEGTAAVVVVGDVARVEGFADVGELLRAGNAGEEAANMAVGGCPEPLDRRPGPARYSIWAVVCVGSTVGSDGSRNLAPFSFFNAFSFSRPVVAVGPGVREGVAKDSLRNICETRELTIPDVTEALAERANLCSAELGYDRRLWAGGRHARSVRRGDAFACRQVTRGARVPRQVVDLGTTAAPANGLVIASATRIYVCDNALDGLIPLPDVFQLVARMGGPLWCTTRDRFRLERPGGVDPEEIKHAVPRREP